MIKITYFKKIYNLEFFGIFLYNFMRILEGVNYIGDVTITGMISLRVLTKP